MWDKKSTKVCFIIIFPHHINIRSLVFLKFDTQRFFASGGGGGGGHWKKSSLKWFGNRIFSNRVNKAKKSAGDGFDFRNIFHMHLGKRRNIFCYLFLKKNWFFYTTMMKHCFYNFFSESGICMRTSQKKNFYDAFLFFFWIKFLSHKNLKKI